MKTTSAFLLAACCYLARLLLAQKPAPVGLQLYSFRSQFAKDIPGTMAKVKQMVSGS